MFDNGARACVRQGNYYVSIPMRHDIFFHPSSSYMPEYNHHYCVDNATNDDRHWLADRCILMIGETLDADTETLSRKIQKFQCIAILFCIKADEQIENVQCSRINDFGFDGIY